MTLLAKKELAVLLKYPYGLVILFYFCRVILFGRWRIKGDVIPPLKIVERPVYSAY